MKTLCTILIIILTIVAVNLIALLEDVSLQICIGLLAYFITGFFGYGVYKFIERFEK
jgi:hypothetical protein